MANVPGGITNLDKYFAKIMPPQPMRLEMAKPFKLRCNVVPSVGRFAKKNQRIGTALQ